MRYLPDVPAELQAAIRFALTHWQETNGVDKNFSGTKSAADAAKKIFLRYLPDVPAELQAAIQFALTHWQEPNGVDENFSGTKSAADAAKNFLSGLSALPTDARNLDGVFVGKLNDAVRTLRNEPSVWLSTADLPHEIWRDVADYEGSYQVSNYGRVKSFQSGKIKIRAARLNRGGYLRLNLSKAEATKTRAIHVIVGQTFLPNYSRALRSL